MSRLFNASQRLFCVHLISFVALPFHASLLLEHFDPLNVEATDKILTLIVPNLILLVPFVGGWLGPQKRGYVRANSFLGIIFP